MSKNTNNTICSQEEFERFKSIYERFIDCLKNPDSFSVEEINQFDDDIEGFWPTIVEIGKKIGVDLTDKLDVVLSIREEAKIEPSTPDCSGWVGEGVEEAIEDVYLEYEDEKRARREAIADLDKVMVTLYASQPKSTEDVKHIATEFEAFLERTKADLHRTTISAKRWGIKRITGWIVAKTSHFILTVIVTILATVIAAIVADIFADLGWLQSIKEFIRNVLWPK